MSKGRFFRGLDKLAGVLSGPIFEESRDGMLKVVAQDAGSHYSVYHLDWRMNDDGTTATSDPVLGMESLKSFVSGMSDGHECFVLFSTSGVHGTYVSLEEIEASLEKYGDDPLALGDDPEPEGYRSPDLTVLIIQPRLVCMRCGNVRVTKADVPFLKSLRDLSKEVVDQYF